MELLNKKILYPVDTLDNYEERFNLRTKHEDMLNILIAFDRYCRDKGICYSLADGTLMGAIRHGDFIPWDDDADVMMTKEEYIKLRDSLNKESPIKLFKICFLDRISTPEYLAKHEFVDLFINEDLPSNCIVFGWKKFVTAFLRTSFNGMAENFRHREFSKTRKTIRKLIINNIGVIARLIIGNYNVFYINEKAVSIGKHKQSGKYTRYTSRMFETRRRFDKKSYEAGYADVLFRNHRLMAIKNADTFLREMYGDYTKLLPEEKRIPEHSVDMLNSDECCIYRFN